MTDSKVAITLFIRAARKIAIARAAETAMRRKAGVLLELNRSQLARDGLSIAAQRFAQSIEGLPPSRAALEQSVWLAASKAPVRTWWKPVFATRPPRELSEGDIWVPAGDVNMLAADDRLTSI